MSNNIQIVSMLDNVVKVLSQNETTIFENLSSATLFEVAKRLNMVASAINELAVRRNEYDMNAICSGLLKEKLVTDDADLSRFLTNCIKESIENENHDFKAALAKVENIMNSKGVAVNNNNNQDMNQPEMPDSPLAKKAESEFMRLGTNSKVTVH